MSEHGPTIYAQLMDAATDMPRRELKKAVEGFLRGGLDGLVTHFEEQLRKAYMAGVADGFAQGVATAEWETTARGREDAYSSNPLGKRGQA